MPLFRRLAPAIVLSVGLSGVAEAAQLCGQEVVSFREMVAGIKANPGTEVTRETTSIIELQDTKRFILWTLAKPAGGLPAAYICRRVVQEDGQVKIHMTAECYGQKLNCDGMIGRILTEQNKATAPLRQR